ncbi:glycoside hydrolase family 3 protein [Neobacillus niacini]|uniref:beta-glucosidase n=1 Tax=Neobacillus niacini TaxID=86668 RepID=UPI0021CB97F6|nr:glycoside hydrolase family 3 C-terminal domain-containing protein [Neobacillus niacini]MCM3763756.1 glycoside hydrolase family 3 C-terminal domain-containing protein [Neobacillus niacini]
MIKRITLIFMTALISMSSLVIPTNAEETRPWMNTKLSAEERTELLLDAMTMEQKIQQIAISRFNENDKGDTVVIKRGGTSKYMNGEFAPQGTLPGCEWQDTGRQIRGIEELGIPTIRMTNGGTGVKGGSCGNDPIATGLPSTLAMAATFDRGLNYEAGRILGEETRAFAHHVLLGPGMNLVRHPYNGRNYEYFSEDPYLTGTLATEQVKGIQEQGVQAQLKHLAGNEQETERWTMGVQVPSKAMNELYMLPFEMTVKNADPASVMCSFPDVNGTFACDSSELLQDALRDKWGFDGYVMSDRRAIHDTVKAIKAGTNVELDWAPQYYTQEKIQEALDSGQVTEDDIDNLLRPRYIKMIEYGHMDEPYDKFMPEIVDPMANGASARKMAEEGAVLLKNDNGFLPLNGEPKSIALIGVEWFAGEAKMSPRSVRDNNENVEAPYTVTPKEGLENVIKELGYDTKVTYNDGRDPEAAAKLAAESDVVLLMVGDNPHETADRDTLGFPAIDLNKNPDKENWVEQEPLIDAVLKDNAEKTTVVLKTSGTVLMPWLDKVPAVLQAWFPGMEDGNAVANLLYGKVNPSGKLPMTFGATEREAAFATEEQYPGTRQDTGKPGGPGPYGNGSDQLIAKYTEGLEMGYRWYEANDVKPLFPFGYGLSYTTFQYDDLKVKKVRGEGKGNNGSLSGIDVSFSVTNTGDVAGKEAAQVYLTLPDEAGQPTKRLVNFEKFYLEPGESKQVTVRINQADANHPFSYFVPEDPDNLANWADGEWATADGKYRVHVGGSSADTPLEKDVPLNFKLSKDDSKDKGNGNTGNNENNGNTGNNKNNGNKENNGNHGKQEKHKNYGNHGKQWNQRSQGNQWNQVHLWNQRNQWSQVHLWNQQNRWSQVNLWNHRNQWKPWNQWNQLLMVGHWAM